MTTNNEYLRNIADGVDPSGATTTRTLNNEYLRRISEGIGNIVVPQTGKVDATRIEGVIPSDNLPSFVDDVIEAYVVGQTAYASDWLSLTANGTALTPESGKIYVVMSGAYADTTYRWGGSSYVPLGSRIEIATQQEAKAGIDDAKMMTPLKVKEAIDANAYSLPTMGANTKGGAKLGSGLVVANDVISTTDDLGITGAEAGQVATVATVDANGVPTSWTASSVRHTLTVTCQTQDSVTVTGQTVTVRELGPDGPVYATASYEGQPVSFTLPVGFAYHVSVTSTLAHHFNPTEAAGVITDADASVILTYADFSSISTAADIQAALDSDIDLTDLVGEQISCSYGSGTYAWYVADYDSTNKVITLLGADCSATSANIQFDTVQALAYFENGLAAGSYSFQNGNNTYYLTLTTTIPEGGQLRATTTVFQTYESQSATSTLETGTVSTTEISGATLLGKCGTETGLYPLNHMDRVSYGSNNYGESGLHAWLNFSGAANEQVLRVTRFSRPYSVNYPGFLGNLDPDFVACVADTVWRCSANNVYECPASMGGAVAKGNPYTVTSKFALVSQREVFGSYDGVDAGDSVLDLFVGATNDDRKMYRGTTAQSWWLRSPYPSYAGYVRYVTTSGGVSNYYAYGSYGVVPACKIRKSS